MNTNPVVDVVVVGSGPSGAVAAKRFNEAGLSVVCLEQGGHPDYSSTESNGVDYDYVKTSVPWNPNRRMIAGDYQIDDRDSDVTPLMWNGVGGSSFLWAAAWHRFKPSDFRVRTVDGVADDWPLTYEDLEPFYTRVEKDFAVSGLPGDPACPGEWAPPLPPFPMTEMDRLLAEAHNRLGWHWWAGSNAIATGRSAGLEPCVRRGRCVYGCFDGAKASVDRTHWPRAIENGVHLITGARVLKIETDRSGQATGVTFADQRTSQQVFQPAGLVVLAANSIGTPRLLLASKSKEHPNGLANSSDLVGRRLMMHPFSVVAGRFEEEFENWQGPTGQRMYSLQFSETPPDRSYLRGAKWQLDVTGGPLAAVGNHPWYDGGSWGPGFHRAIRSRFRHGIAWNIVAEDLPDPENRLVLDPVRTDSDGLPIPVLHYRSSENTQRLLRHNEELAARSLREAGAVETFVAPSLKETGWHLMGTAVMGDDPATSVVDGFGRAHDVPNLIVVDASVMPTSSCVNPTGTLTALALRSAEAAVNGAVATRREVV